MKSHPVRPIDWESVTAAALDDRFMQRLIDPADGDTACSATLIRTPPGGGSALGLHTHDFDQVFYLMEGTMSIEVDGEVATAEAGSVIVFPEGVPHRNWNAGDVPTLHLSIGARRPESAG
jgi:quercetin dioxygenase-like cupin family protein